jgi:hypothetical protein
MQPLDCTIVMGDDANHQEVLSIVDWSVAQGAIATAAEKSVMIWTATAGAKILAGYPATPRSQPLVNRVRVFHRWRQLRCFFIYHGEVRGRPVPTEAV